MTTLVGLALGASVVYRRPTDEGERAAIVVDIGDGTGRNATLLILGLPTEGLSYAQYAVFDDRDDHAGGTWRWPLLVNTSAALEAARQLLLSVRRDGNGRCRCSAKAADALRREFEHLGVAL